MRKVSVIVMLCIGLACGWAAQMFCGRYLPAGRYTAAPAGIAEERELEKYPVLWLEPEGGCFQLSYGGMYSSMQQGTYLVEGDRLVCREGSERYHMFVIEAGGRLRYVGSEQPKGTPLEEYYAALLPAGQVDFAERQLEGKTLRYLDEKTILEGWTG